MAGCSRTAPHHPLLLPLSLLMVSTLPASFPQAYKEESPSGMCLSLEKRFFFLTETKTFLDCPRKQIHSCASLVSFFLRHYWKQSLLHFCRHAYFKHTAEHLSLLSIKLACWFCRLAPHYNKQIFDPTPAGKVEHTRPRQWKEKFQFKRACLLSLHHYMQLCFLSFLFSSQSPFKSFVFFLAKIVS